MKSLRRFAFFFLPNRKKQQFMAWQFFFLQALFSSSHASSEGGRLSHSSRGDDGDSYSSSSSDGNFGRDSWDQRRQSFSKMTPWKCITSLAWGKEQDSLMENENNFADGVSRNATLNPARQTQLAFPGVAWSGRWGRWCRANFPTEQGKRKCKNLKCKSKSR